MCFGGKETVKEVSKTSNQTAYVPQYLEDAGKFNVGYAQDLVRKGFTPYDGERVADFSQDQQDAFGMVRDLASQDNPYLADIEKLFGQYATADAQNLSTPSILGGDYDVRGGSIKDYMNPYIDAVLNPQIMAIERAGAQARNRNATAATMEGAFGDSRHGVMDAAQVRDENQLVTDTTGKAYAGAFDAASRLRSGDIDNLMKTDQSNALFAEEALKRALGGGTALQGLDKYQMGRNLDLARSLDAVGGEQTQNTQNKLNAMYEQYLREQAYGPEMAKLLASISAAQPYTKQTTGNSNETTTAPDNSGWQILGSLGGTALSAALAPVTGGASLALMPMLGTLSGNPTGATHTADSYSSAFPMPLG